MEDECSLFTHRRYILGIANAGFYLLTLARDAKVFLAHLPRPLIRYCPPAGQLTVASGWGLLSENCVRGH